MAEKILFVDDEPAVLDGYRRLLGRDFAIETAEGGNQGLALIVKSTPYAVVVSDMRMPGMNGAQFLQKVREAAPTTVRLALTGYVDIDTAISAVNEGNIFRFLTKPCSKENLTKAIEAGLEQHRLLNAEKELLEQTLRGAVEVLAEVLSFSNPAAFGRAMRLRRFAQHVAARLALADAWQFEIAAMLSQLGCVTLPTELATSALSGAKLTPEDQKKFDGHPARAWQMLSKIPRMQAIAEMIANQGNFHPKIDSRNAAQKERIEFGIQLLQTGIAFERNLTRGQSPAEAVKWVAADLQGCDVRILRCLDDFAPTEEKSSRECAITDLALGMTLRQDIHNGAGLLIVAKGQELTYQWIERLKEFSKQGIIGRRVAISLPVGDEKW